MSFNIRDLLPPLPFVGLNNNGGHSKCKPDASSYINGFREGFKEGAESADSCEDSCRPNSGYGQGYGNKNGNGYDYRGTQRGNGHGHGANGNGNGHYGNGNGQGSGGGYGGYGGGYGGSQGSNGCGDQYGNYGGGSSHGVNKPHPNPNGGVKLTGQKVGTDGIAKTPGGYTIKATGGDAQAGGQIEVTAPDGKKTLIWGDPHASIDKDGNGPGGYEAAFDYKGNLNVTLPDGTKIETETTKLDNGTTVLKRAGVINGKVGVAFGPLSEGKDKLQVNVGNGAQLDAQIADGTSVLWNRGGNGTYTASNGFGGYDREVTQSYIDSQEALGAGAGNDVGTSWNQGRVPNRHNGGNEAGQWRSNFDRFFG
ncbi:hypothetical protein BH09PSE5_BH09PSE5_16950 [soil metagenome]